MDYLTTPQAVFPSANDSWVIRPDQYQNPLVSYVYPTSNNVGYIGAPIRMKSYTISLAPRIRAFRAIEEQIGKRYIDRWTPKNGAQKDFVYLLYSDAAAPSPVSAGVAATAFSLSHPAISELINNMRIFITDNINHANQFLRDNSSRQKVIMDNNPNKLASQTGHYVSIIMNLKLKWIAPALPTRIGNIFKGFKILSPNFDIVESEPYEWEHLIRLYTSNPQISIFIKMKESTHYNPQDPYEEIRGITSKRRSRYFYDTVKQKYSAINIPNVLMNFVEDTNHLSGLCIPVRKTRDLRNKYVANPIEVGATSANSFRVAEVKQETRVSMNDKGLGSKSSILAGVKPVKYRYNVYDGSSGGYMESFGNMEFTVDKNFIMWIEHDYVKHPIFVGYFNQDSWERV